MAVVDDLVDTVSLPITFKSVETIRAMRGLYLYR